jgi:ribosomal protein S18 acetylase RimI-like enzyme
LPEVSIRRLETDDRAEWRRMWTGYLEFYRVSVDEAVYRATFERLLGDDPRDFSGLIAHVDGVPAGLAHFLFHRHGWKLRDVCYLQDLWVEPGFRGAGAGTALIRAVYAAADTAGAPDVYWLTAADNDAARRLYDRVGQLTPFIKYRRA